MIDYEEDLVSLRISIFSSNCDKLLVSHDITLDPMSYTRIIGVMMLNWNVLTILWGWLMCMWYKDGENYEYVVICYEMLKC